MLHAYLQHLRRRVRGYLHHEAPVLPQLAQEYALRFAAAYPAGVFWLRAHGHDDRSARMSPDAHETDRATQLMAFVRKLQIATAALAPEELSDVLEAELDRRAAAFLWVIDDVPLIERRDLRAP